MSDTAIPLTTLAPSRAWRLAGGIAIVPPLLFVGSAWGALLLAHGDVAPAWWSLLADPAAASLLALQSLCGPPAGATFAGRLLMGGLMAVAMMLPFATPGWRALLQGGRPREAYRFLAGFLLVWLGFAAFGAMAETALSALAPADNGVGPAALFAALGLAAAGLYQFGGVKRSALHALRCGPPGVAGTGGGLAYGLRCLACDGPLMALAALLGAMNLPAMLGLTAVMAGEKLGGRAASVGIGALLVGLAGAALAFGWSL